MSFERGVAFRFMLKGTEKGSFSLLTFFAWMAIAIGVAAMSSLLSVMYGFESALIKRVMTAYPHLMIRGKDSQVVSELPKLTEKIRAKKGVSRVEPYLESEMVVQSDHRALGGVVWGLEKEAFEKLKPSIVS